MTFYFTSDTHYSHRNVLTYTARPFKSVDEMDAALVNAWNRTVTHTDTVWHLGDFALGPVDRAVEIAKALRGHKHLIWGNHDKATRKSKEFVALWESTHDLATVKVQDAQHPHGMQRIVCCHYALKVWDHSHHGAWHLFGHSHGSPPDDPHSLSLDVSVDAWESNVVEVDHDKREILRSKKKLYRPVSYDEVKARMATKTWRPVDGHVGKRE